MDRIDLYLDALGRAMLVAGDIDPWPVDISVIFPYFSDLEAADLFSKMKAISARGPVRRLLPGLLVNASVAKTTLVDLVIGMKCTEPPTPADERVWFVRKLFDALKAMQAGDVFCRDGTSRMLSETAAQQLYDDTEWTSLSSRKDFGTAAYRLSAAAKALVWSLHFFAWNDVAFQIHGPYHVSAADGGRLQLIIRDFFDIRPVQLWPSIEHFPYKSMQIFAVHKPEADLTMDMFGHLFHSAPLQDTTVGMAVKIDGALCHSPEEIADVSRRISQQVREQRKVIDSMTKEEIIYKFIESRYWAFRGWRAYFDEDWRPPAAVQERIKQWGVLSAGNDTPFDWNKMRAAFDPRTDTVPGPD